MTPKRIARAGLAHVLKATEGGLILLEAPAGFGKTQAMLQWKDEARKARQQVSWLPLLPTDRAASHLAQRLLTTLGEAGLKGLPKVVNGKLNVAEFVESLTRALTRHRRRMLLVLDDYHVMEQDSADELLQHFFLALPANLTVCLATRRICPIPLSRVILQGRLQRLSMESLAFTKAEARAFFNSSLRPGVLRRLHELTDGWPAALEMARVCLPDWQKHHRDILNVPAFARLIRAYCDNEVLAYAGAPAVELLIECSISGVLEPRLCDAIRDQGDSAQLLAGLTARETFMKAENLQNNQYSLPSLLRHVLERRAVERGRAFVAAANLRAAEFLKRENEILPSLRHFLKAHQPETAAAALESASLLTIATIQGDTVGQALIDLIPHDQLVKFPRLVLCRVFLDFKRGLMDEARALFAELSERTHEFTVDRPGGNDGQLKAEALCVEVIMEFYSRSRAPVEYLRKLDRQIPVVSKADARLGTLFHLILGLLHEARGDLNAAQTQFIQCEKLNVREPQFWITVWLKYHFATLAIARGQLVQAKHHLQAGLRMWAVHFRNYASYRAMVQLALAEIAYETNALPQAQTALDDALYSAEHIEGWFETYAAVYEVKMMIHWHAGEIDKIEAMLRNSIAIPRVGVLLESFCHALMLRFAVLQKNYSVAQKIVDAHAFDKRWQAPDFEEEFAYREWDLVGLCLCRIAIHQKDFPAAIDIADRLDQVARLAGRGRAVAKASVLRSIIENERNHPQQAATHLLSAIETAHAQGYKRVFLDEGTLIRPVFQLLLDRKELLPLTCCLSLRS